MLRMYLAKFFRTVFKVFRVIMIIALIATICAIGVLAYKFTPVFKQYVSEADELVRGSSASTFYPDNTSHIYASDGTEITKLRLSADSTYVTYDQLPKDVMHAFVAIEDKRFYQHHGVDWGSTVKAALLRLKGGSITRGGSTITQQLVRNVFSENIGFDKSYTRKFKEILTALFLERKYSKKQILEYYINNINFANNYYGIGAASYGYFGKSVDELSETEIAFLCAIPNNPTYYNPRTNMDHTIKRRNIILKEMYDQGYLKRAEYLKAVNVKVTLVPEANDFYNYESSFAVKCATESLMKSAGFHFRYNFDSQPDYDDYQEEYADAYKDAEHLLYTGGFSVYTTLDLSVQNSAQKALDKELKDFKSKDKNGIYNMQGAATVIDNSTGKVIACVGGRSQNSSYYSLNRAFQAYQQPGSTIKPLIVYTPALQKGYTPDSIVDDSTIKDGPKNSDNSYAGKITLRKAVEKSKNVVAWRLFSEITPRVGLSFAQSMHFNKITPNDYYKPAALGGLYYGVTTVQMASGYATLAYDGFFREPDCIKDIQDSSGKSVYEKEAPSRVYSSDAVNQMLDILTGVANTGTAAGLKLPDNKKMPIACKTGTTNNQHFAWFCGVTPYYSVAVYVGRDDSKPTDGLWGASYPKYVWRDIQNNLCNGKEVKKLYKKVKVQQKKVKSDAQVTNDSVQSQNTDNSSGTSIDNSSSRQNSYSKPVPKPSQTPSTPTQKPSTKPSTNPAKPTHKPTTKPTHKPEDTSSDTNSSQSQDDSEDQSDQNSQDTQHDTQQDNQYESNSVENVTEN